MVRDTVRASDYIVADSAFLMRELSPANAGITRSFFYYFCFVFGERPVLFGREPNPVIRSWDKRGHVQTATRAQGVGAIDAAHFHDLHTLCIPSISETCHVQTATLAQGVGAIDAAHFHDLHTLCIPSISETLMKTETFVGMVCY